MKKNLVKIFFDARWIRKHPTGVGVFTENILTHLPSNGHQYFFLVNPEFQELSLSLPGEIIETAIRPDAHPKTEWLEQIWIPWFMIRKGCRHFWAPEGRVPVWHPGFKTYSVIHDITTFVVPQSHPFKYTLFMKVYLMISQITADVMITDAVSVKNEISRRYGQPRGDLRAILLSDSGLYRVAPVHRPETEGAPYFLMVGVTNKRKNLGFALNALMLLPGSENSPRLVVTGNRELIQAELAHSPLLQSRVHNLGYVSQRELAGLYQKAAGLVYPSLEEGFGLPLLDSVRFRIPALCSDIPLFREVLGRGGNYFSLEDPVGLTRLMARCLAGELKAPPWDERFSWEGAAQNLIQLMEEKD